MKLNHCIWRVSATILLVCGLMFLKVGCEEGGDVPGITVIYQQSFDSDPGGIYSRAQLDSGWNNPSWERGVSAGRVRISSDGSMQVAYPAGGVGLGAGGAAWLLAVGQSYDSLVCRYRFRFAPGFDFVRGGKLPGLAGGTANTGGRRPNGQDGWSARLMWRSGGSISAYVYHPDQPGRYGEDFRFSSNVTAGEWYEVTMRVTMNTPGFRDGRIECWLNGDKVLDENSLRFRDVYTLGVDQFYFCTFFGGNDPSWAPTRNEYIVFDDFEIGN